MTRARAHIKNLSFSIKRFTFKRKRNGSMAHFLFNTFFLESFRWTSLPLWKTTPEPKSIIIIKGNDQRRRHGQREKGEGGMNVYHCVCVYMIFRHGLVRGLPYISRRNLEEPSITVFTVEWHVLSIYESLKTIASDAINNSLIRIRNSLDLAFKSFMISDVFTGRAYSGL